MSMQTTIATRLHLAALLFVLLSIVQLAAAADCGVKANGTLCGYALCCSKNGFCGTTEAYCGKGCQSQCEPPPTPPLPPLVGKSRLAKVFNESLFNVLFPNRNRFYTYRALLVAAQGFPSFANEGSKKTRLREIAAFAAHTQQETAGLVYIEEINQSNDYCDKTNTEYPCAPGKKYFGRGPIQLSWNFNYGPASKDIGVDILAQPDLVARDPVIAFKTFLWFWTKTRESGIPSVHDVIVGKWRPTAADKKAGRKPGFGMTTLIINGGLECGKKTPQASNRVTYFKERTALLGTSTGPNLSCQKMTPFGG